MNPIDKWPTRKEVFDKLKARPGYEEIENVSYTPGDGEPVSADVIADNIERAINEIHQFNDQPEETKLRFYLAQSLSALKQILDLAPHDLSTIGSDREALELRIKLSEICGIADMAVLTVPNKYRKEA
jgi:hypothetical protein